MFYQVNMNELLFFFGNVMDIAGAQRAPHLLHRQVNELAEVQVQHDVSVNSRSKLLA